MGEGNAISPKTLARQLFARKSRAEYLHFTRNITSPIGSARPNILTILVGGSYAQCPESDIRRTGVATFHL